MTGRVCWWYIAREVNDASSKTYMTDEEDRDSGVRTPEFFCFDIWLEICLKTISYSNFQNFKLKAEVLQGS